LDLNMSNIAIRVEHLGKRYRIGGKRAVYKTLRESLVGFSRAPLRWFHRGGHSEENTFWALNDLSFEIMQGDAVGIIGRNGAGKSTLLKIISRITKPSRGKVELFGRVGSLLEVGTGFHPELTGRENIYLNGAILGMRRGEISRKFDEIVDFAEVDKFLDTPVKYFSSGMYVRLAFAVAAHMQPDILLVDEVLAVGDAEFQKKCLGKMSNVAGMGRTVLFVSHNMSAIQRLCPQTIWIDSGRLRQFGPSLDTIRSYLNRSGELSGAGEIDLRDWQNRYGSGEARILSARLLDENGKITTTFHRGNPMKVEFIFESLFRRSLHFSMVVLSDTGIKILHLSHHDTPGVDVDTLEGNYRASFTIPELPLCAGNYLLVLGIHTMDMNPVDVVTNILPFAAEDRIDSPRPYRTISENGFCWSPNHFSITPLH
jgi:lipopolysaccharide transport system ATP-binding protein